MTEPVQATPTPIEALADKGPLEPPRSQWKDVWDQFRKHKGAMFGGGFLLFITLAVLLRVRDEPHSRSVRGPSHSVASSLASSRMPWAM